MVNKLYNVKQKNKNSLELWKKVDFWGIISLASNLIGFSVLISGFGYPLCFLSIPNKLMIHGPIVVQQTGTTVSENKIICNKFHEKFSSNYSVYTNEMLESKRLVSDSFLEEPGVGKFVYLWNIDTAQSYTKLGFGVFQICTVVADSSTPAYCTNYHQIYDECKTHIRIKEILQNLHSQRFSFYMTLGFGVLGDLLVCITMFDPPPIRLTKIPYLALIAAAFAVTAAASLYFVIQIYLWFLFCSSYLNTLKVPPSSLAPSFYRFILAVNPFTIATQVYFYLFCFTPKYPRLNPRLLKRRERYKKSLRILLEEHMGKAYVAKLDDL